MKRKLCLGLAAACMFMILAGCGKTGGGQGENGSAQVSASVTATADEKGNYLVNGSFEEPDFTGWNVTNIDNVTEELDVYTRETDCFEGVQSLHFYSGSSDVNFTAEQTVSGLEAGTYKMTAHIQGDTAGDENASVYFYAVINGETIKADASLNGYVNWYTAELAGLSVEDGEVTVGVSVKIAPGGWGTIDDITLVKE
ncbi:MAG: hypothetical protein K2L82_03420 [Lachnospiraceae bacterium]|nr:hypothetical protein [Lachnospiraceae bacterium]